MSDNQAELNLRYSNALIDQGAAFLNRDTAKRRGYWAVVLGLNPFPDGDQWCLMWGQNIQEGVCAFGSSPQEAIEKFDIEMSRVRSPPPAGSKENDNG